jgi:hypothetical protein
VETAGRLFTGGAAVVPAAPPRHGGAGAAYSALGVRVLGPITEDEMVLAFLRAEVDSSSFSDTPRAILGTRQPIDAPNLGNEAENALRRTALGAYRGYGLNAVLFAGFPTDVTWQSVALSRTELGEVRYLNYRTWVELSGGSRLVKDGAANVELVPVADVDKIILPIERDIREGEEHAPIILVGQRPGDSLIILEGCKRATAYYRALPKDAELVAIAGYSESLSDWIFF